MKTLTLAVTLASLAFTLTTPGDAAPVALTVFSLEDSLQGDFDKRSKPRIPGGSGCDDAGDAAEHPECR